MYIVNSMYIKNDKYMTHLWPISDEEEAMRSVQQAQKVRDIQQENHHLEQLMTQMKMVNNWKQNYKGGLHARSVSKVI